MFVCIITSSSDATTMDKIHNDIKSSYIKYKKMIQ